MKRTREVYEYINTWLDELKPEVTELINDWCISMEPEISKFVTEAKNNFKQEIITDLLKSNELKKMIKYERSNESKHQKVGNRKHQEIKITFEQLMSKVCGKTVNEAETILKNE